MQLLEYRDRVFDSRWCHECSSRVSVGFAVCRSLRETDCFREALPGVCVELCVCVCERVYVDLSVCVCERV